MDLFSTIVDNEVNNFNGIKEKTKIEHQMIAQFLSDGNRSELLEYIHTLTDDLYSDLITSFFLEACRVNNLNDMKVFLSHPNCDANRNFGCAMFYAIKNKNIEMVELLYDEMDPVFFINNLEIIDSPENGPSDCLLSIVINRRKLKETLLNSLNDVEEKKSGKRKI